jgi:cystathionine beta-lyase
VILDLPLSRLRTRRSVKWARYGPDVLPLWVAEMDTDNAEPIHEALQEMIEGSDTGYAWAGDLAEAYRDFARTRWDLAVDPARVYVLQDVMRAVLEVLAVGTAPGDGVVINPPVYYPFFSVVRHIGRSVVEVPLQADQGRYRLDLAGLERAFRDGARAYLLCSPHNPVGRVWDHAELAAVVELCTAHDVLLVVDEIHAPLVHDGQFVPVHTVPGAQDALSVMSASKTWNLAGLKCAVLVAASERGWATVTSIGEEVGYGTGILGVAAARAAFADGGPWLDQLLVELDQRRHQLADLLAEQLPAVRYRPPEGTFLAWLDVSGLGLADPQAHFLRAGVALDPGEKFGTGGDGFVRLNFACSADLLERAVTTMAASL